MDFIPLLIVIVLLGIVAYAILKFIKKVVSKILMVIAILCLGFLVFVFLLSSDLSDLRSGLENDTKVFLAMDGKTAIAGFVMAEEFTPVAHSELERLSVIYANGTLTGIDDARLFIFSKEALQSNPSRMVPLDSAHNFSRAELTNAFYAQSTSEQVALILGVPKSIVNAQYSENDLKARLFGYLAQDTLRDSALFTSLYRNGSVESYPEGLSLWALKSLPESFARIIVRKAFVTKEVP